MHHNRVLFEHALLCNRNTEITRMKWCGITVAQAIPLSNYSAEFIDSPLYQLENEIILLSCCKHQHMLSLKAVQAYKPGFLMECVEGWCLHARQIARYT